MAKAGPIILIEDDPDDKSVLEIVFEELNVHNKLIWFTNSKDSFDYLRTTSEQPFVILCDINLPLQSGIDFKRELDADPQLRKKSIPFVFYSTSVDQRTVNDAYIKITVQGYFQKKSSFKEIKDTIKVIVDYWQVCKHPNSI